MSQELISYYNKVKELVNELYPEPCEDKYAMVIELLNKSQDAMRHNQQDLNNLISLNESAQTKFAGVYYELDIVSNKIFRIATDIMNQVIESSEGDKSSYADMHSYLVLDALYDTSNQCLTNLQHYTVKQVKKLHPAIIKIIDAYLYLQEFDNVQKCVHIDNPDDFHRFASDNNYNPPQMILVGSLCDLVEYTDFNSIGIIHIIERNPKLLFMNTMHEQERYEAMIADVESIPDLPNDEPYDYIDELLDGLDLEPLSEIHRLYIENPEYDDDVIKAIDKARTSRKKSARS